MLILITIVHHGFFLNTILRNLESDANSAIIARRRGQRCDLKRIERLASVSIRHPGQMLHRLGCRLAVQVAQPSLHVTKGALDQLDGFILRNWLKFKNL